MKVLVDTNIILDFLLERSEYYQNAKVIVEKSASKEIQGIIAAHTVSNMFFILRKIYSVSERRAVLKNVCNIFEVAGIDHDIICRALNNDGFSDFEDCLQMECANTVNAKYIVTRNPDDFKNSVIKVISPQEFVGIL